MALAFALVLCLSMFACGDGEETTAPTLDEGKDGDTYSAMDYMKEDLSGYVKLGQYKGLKVNAPRHIVTEAEIDAEIQDFIDAHTTYEPYEVHVTDRATVAGDFVNVSYVGKIDGEAFEGGSAEADSIVLTENNGYIDWFEDDLYGIMPGTTVVSTGFFPEDYHEHLAGKEVSFEITLNYIAGHYTIPEFNDGFVKEKLDFDSAEAYREFLRDLLQKESDAEYDVQKYQLMWSQIMANAETLELPTAQIMYYYTSERSIYEVYAAENGYTYDELLAQLGVTDEYLREVMGKRVEEEIIFYSIVKAEGLEVTDEDYANGVIEYAEAQGLSESALVEQYGEEYIRECVLWDKMMYTLGEMNSFVE